MQSEIPFSSYDPHRKAYVYAIRGAPNAALKRRRFRDFVKLRDDLLADWPNAPELPSKLFSTSAEIRRPVLQTFLQSALQTNTSSRVLLDFIGLDTLNPIDNASASATLDSTIVDTSSLLLANERITQLVNVCILLIVLLSIVLLFSLPSTTVFLLCLVVELGVANWSRPIVLSKLLVHPPVTSPSPQEQLALAVKPSTVSLEPLGLPDLSISESEKVKLRLLRERLEDFLRPQDEPQWSKTHAEAISVWKPDMTRILNPALREKIWKENVLMDRRLVWFIRGTNNLDEAEYSMRDAMLSRMVFAFDEVHEDLKQPPAWIVEYAASPVLTKYMQDPVAQREERIKNFWLRDKDDNLLIYNRPGPAKSQAINDKFKGDEKVMLQVLCWYIEALRGDFDYMHDLTQGKTTCQVTLVTDLTDFALSYQMSAGTVLPLARKYVPILAPIYRGVLKRVIVINAPWYINMLMKLITPFVPREILDCISIHGSFDLNKHLRPFVEDKYIPKYLGGDWEGNPDEHFPPSGPWRLPDKGDSLLVIE